MRPDEQGVCAEDCGARVRASLRLRPGSRVCPGAAAAPALSSLCPLPAGVGPSPRPRATGLPAGLARPGLPTPWGSALGGVAGLGWLCPLLKGRRESLRRLCYEGPAGAQAEPGGWTAACTSGCRQGLAGLGRPGQGRGSRRRACVRGCVPGRPSGRRGRSWIPFLGTHACPRPSWPGALGNRCCVGPGPSGPRTQGGRGRCGCRSGVRPALSGLPGFPLAGPLQGQLASLGGFRLLPG